MTTEAAAGPQHVIHLDQLPPQQLLLLRKNLDTEITALTQHVVDLRTATKAFETSQAVVHDFGQCVPGTKSLVPLSESVYVMAELEDTDKVLVDIGTGYLVERSTDQAEEYCSRRVRDINSAITKALNVITQKKRVLTMVDQRMQAVLQQQRPAMATAQTVRD